MYYCVYIDKMLIDCMGSLCFKKSIYMKQWRPRVFNLHSDNRMRYYDVHGRPLGIAVLKEGTIVRVLNGSEENSRFQVSFYSFYLSHESLF